VGAVVDSLKSHSEPFEEMFLLSQAGEVGHHDRASCRELAQRGSGCHIFFS
jgi:hypothetical protein